MVEIVDPRGQKLQTDLTITNVGWPTTLLGSRIGFFGNGKSNVETFFLKWANLANELGVATTFDNERRTDVPAEETATNGLRTKPI